MNEIATIDDLQATVAEMSINSATMMLLLKHKGIVTDDDAELYLRCRAQATALWDQQLAEAEAEGDEQ